MVRRHDHVRHFRDAQRVVEEHVAVREPVAERHVLRGRVCSRPGAYAVVVVVPDGDAVPVAADELKDVCASVADEQVQFGGTTLG
jgi:hypothetical protein